MNQVFVLALLLTLCASGPLKAQSSIKPFQTDGCTLFFDGTLKEPELWRDCCVEHDLYYWIGGLKEKQTLADLKLKQCLQNKNAPILSHLMYYAVVLGHFSPIKHRYQWGWGRAKRRNYLPLSDEEKIDLEKNLEKNLKD